MYDIWYKKKGDSLKCSETLLYYTIYIRAMDISYIGSEYVDGVYVLFSDQFSEHPDTDTGFFGKLMAPFAICT